MNNWAHCIRAVAFDMDGLMVNTEELYTIVGDTILERRGRQFTRELKKNMMGLPGPAAWQVMIDQEQLSDSIDALSEEADTVFEELLPSRLETLPGLIELLDFLDELAIPRCVATSSSHKFARQVLSLVRLGERFDFVVTAEDVCKGKPAPDIYFAAAHRMGVQAPEMMVLEDSEHGCNAGATSGAYTIAVPGEHSADHDFSQAQFQAKSLADPTITTVLRGKGE